MTRVSSVSQEGVIEEPVLLAVMVMLAVKMLAAGVLEAAAPLAVRVMLALDLLECQGKRQAGALLLVCCHGNAGTHPACCHDNAGPPGVHRDVVDGITMPQALLQQHQETLTIVMTITFKRPFG